MQHLKEQLGSPESSSQKSRLNQIVQNSISLLFQATPLGIGSEYNDEETSKKAKSQSKSENKRNTEKQIKADSEESEDEDSNEAKESTSKKKNKSEQEFDYKSLLEKSQQRLEAARKSSNRPSDINEMSLSQLREEKSVLKKELKSFETLYQKTFGVQAGKAEKEPLRILFQRYRQVKSLVEEKEADESENKNSQSSGAAIESSGSNQSATVSQTANTVAELNIKTTESRKRHLVADELKNSEERESKRAGSSKSSPKNKENSEQEKGNQPLLKQYQELKAEKRKLQVFLHEFQNNFVQTNGRKVETREDRKPVQKEYNRYQELKGLLTELEKKLPPGQNKS